VSRRVGEGVLMKWILRGLVGAVLAIWNLYMILLGVKFFITHALEDFFNRSNDKN
jgi:hypothetical protein